MSLYALSDLPRGFVESECSRVEHGHGSSKGVVETGHRSRELHVWAIQQVVQLISRECLGVRDPRRGLLNIRAGGILVAVDEREEVHTAVLVSHLQSKPSHLLSEVGRLLERVLRIELVLELVMNQKCTKDVGVFHIIQTRGRHVHHRILIGTHRSHRDAHLKQTRKRLTILPEVAPGVAKVVKTGEDRRIAVQREQRVGTRLMKTTERQDIDQLFARREDTTAQ